MECGTCDWFESMTEQEGFCAFTSETMFFGRTAHPEEYACRDKTFAEWEAAHPDWLRIPLGWETLGRGIVSPDASEMSAVGYDATGTEPVPASRPIAMLPSSEWRLGYRMRSGNRHEGPIMDRIAAIV